MSNIRNYPKAILFDWDDTLIDNWHSIHGGLNAALIAMGQQPWSIEKTKSNVRRSMRDSFPALFGKKWKEAANIYLTHVKRNHLETINILNFVPELLDYIDKEETYLAVVSNKNGALLRQEIDFLKWKNLFSSVVGADDAIRDKPDRAPIDMALDGSGILNSTQVWFVGDAPSDIECAHNAGVLGVLLQNESNKQDKFGEFQPHLTFKNAGELLNYLILIKQSGQKGSD